jgi:hypothetical protein
MLRQSPRAGSTPSWRGYASTPEKHSASVAGVTSLNQRRRLWAEQSAVLALLDDAELGALVDRSRTDGWGGNSTAALPDGRPAFVKRLPLTELEHDHSYSTRNHFRLPAFYQYGVGSAGFGAWRELATHIKTTGWVVDGSCPGFPMLLHHRVVRRRPTHERHSVGARSWVDSPDYAIYWNGRKRIASFIEARRTTPFELWLVLEHVPYRLDHWLSAHLSATGKVIDQLVATIRFLHDHGVFHFDAHHGNVVTEGHVPLLTDFGLASDRAFRLSTEEHAFLDTHRHYDFGETIYSSATALWERLEMVPGDQRGALLRRYRPDMPTSPDPGSIIEALVANVEALADDGALAISPAYVSVVTRYRPVILFMNAFFSSMRTNRRKNTVFDDARLARLLAEAGVDVG